MPVLYDRIDTDILMVTYDGQITAEDAAQPLKKLIEVSQEISPVMLHLIYDVRTIDMKFNDFVAYVSHAAERRREGIIPANIKQHIIGTNQWMQSLRNWFNKQYEVEMPLFTDLESALSFIQDAKKSA